ncbi:hypothetical protein O7632_10780 [Solwaraspora sp. WMMD406]|nr:hypothetical protein [Solwaraspora sp. WMMD406]MDG4764583.1 hypothetical protein [Solwaraspora sp. WMMD406]
MADSERRRRRHRHSTTSAGPDSTTSADVPDALAADGPPATTGGISATTPEVHDLEPDGVGGVGGIGDSGTGSGPVGTPRRPDPGSAHRPRRPAASGPSGSGRPAGATGTAGGHHGAAEDRDTDRGLRGLVGSGTSQVSPGAALRARDASRPSEADLAAAEDLTIVRRHWVPREELPRRGG